MKTGLCFRLAVTGMRKNRKLYIPYLLTCVMMVSMFYIVAYISQTEALAEMKGADDLGTIMKFGSAVICIFSFVFLFYTNSFLVRRRMKEYGLYNMLGMGKKDIRLLILCESLLSYIVTALLGIAAGILLSRLAEMILLKLAGGIVRYSFSIPKRTVAMTFVVFALVFLLIFLNSLKIVGKSKAVELLRSETVGEKPPKSNLVLALAGAVILGGAYYLAVAIEEPMEAFIYFFIAVVMVIVGTYFLFIAGSVLVCKLLQKNKKYYYSRDHYVSTSQMTYRMKRNGAGLASICVLMTMVLVTVSTTLCLYLGSEDCMHSRYPREINVRWMQYGYEYGGDRLPSDLLKKVDAVVQSSCVESANLRYYNEYSITGYLENSSVQMILNSQTNLAFIKYDKVCEVHFIDIADYNRMYGTDIKLEPGEAVIQTVRTDDLGDVFTCGDLSFKVVERIPDHTLDLFGSSDASVCSTMFVFIPDMYETAKYYDVFKDYDGTDLLCHAWYYEFDTAESQSDETLYTLTKNIYDELYKTDHWHLSSDSQQLKRSDFYGTFGSLLFLGGILSVIFLAAAILIIYYKQISEGFEDQSRFEIMQKIGMTKADIRKNINSQMKLLFLLPITAAAIHLCFAFPFMNRLLVLFGLLNVKLLMLVTGGCLLVFALIYFIAYRLTSNAYYNLVA